VEKKRLKQEKLNEVISQAKKVEKAILLSEQREVELKNEKQREAEVEKNRLRDMTQETEHLKHQTEELKIETDELTIKLQNDTKRHKESMQQLENKKGSLVRDLENILDGYKKEVQTNEAHQREYNDEIEELYKKVDILGKKEEEKKEELSDKQQQLDQLKDQEIKCIQRLDELSSDDNMTPELHTYIHKLTTLQKEKTELVLELERLRKTYPLEVALVEKQEEYDTLTTRFVKEKDEYITRRKKIQENIDELHKELHAKEEENEQLRRDFSIFKKSEEEEISIEKRRVDSARRFFELKVSELKDLERLHARATQMYAQFTDSQKLNLRLIENDIAVLNEELGRFEEEKTNKLKSLQQELFNSVDEAEAEATNFNSTDIGVASCFIAGVPSEIITSVQELRSQQSLLSNETKDLESELVNLYKVQAPIINDKILTLATLKEEYPEESEAITRSLQEIEELQQHLYVTYKSKLIAYREMLRVRSSSPDLQEHERNIDNLQYDILESVIPFLKDKFTHAEHRAEAVVTKKFRIPKIIEVLEKNSFDIAFQRDLLVNWRRVLHDEQEEILTKLKTADETMGPYVTDIEDKMNILHNHINATSDLIESIRVTEKEAELKKKIDVERHRLSTFGQYVSYVEEKINSLSIEKRRAEQGWDSVVSHEKEFETVSQEERTAIQDALAAKYKTQTQTEVSEAGDRLHTLTKMIRKIRQITIVLEKARNQADSDDTGDLIGNVIERQHQVQQETKELQSLALDIQADLDNLSSELNVICKERRRLDEHLQNLILEEKHSGTIQIKEIKMKESKKDELERLLRDITRQELIQQEEHERSMLPMKQQIDRNRKEIGRLTNIQQKQKKDLTAMKSHIDAIEARYTSEISRIRGQRQLLRHRLDLKMKAIENIKNVDPTLSTVNLNTFPNKQGNKSTSVSNKTMSGRSQKTQQDDNTYFKMYIKKKDPDLEGRNAFTAYDQELHDALLSSRESSPVIDKQQLHKPSENTHREIIREQPQQQPQQFERKNVSTVSRSVAAHEPKYTSNATEERELEQEVSDDLDNRPKKATIRLFGPQTKPLTEKEAQFVIEKIQYMCNGSLLHKKRDKIVGKNTSGAFDVRHVSLSQELTRLQIRDQKKKVPESFSKYTLLL
jgi:uncharacterized protein YaiE (UPF0345 family)